MKEFFKFNLVKIIVVFAVIAIDLIGKEVFFGSSFSVIPGLIGVRALGTLNTGGAWSLFSDHTWLLVLVSVVFIILVVIFDLKFKKSHILYKLAVGFIVGGAIGNMIDRIFLGGVRDFIFFDFWENYPTFNLSDSFLLVGMVLLVVFIIFIYKPNNKVNKQNS